MRVVYFSELGDDVRDSMKGAMDPVETGGSPECTICTYVR